MPLPRPRILAALAVLCGTLAIAWSAGPAAAARPRPWATINICDTPRHPNRMGVRASIPGNGSREQIYVRIHVQYRDPATGRFRDLGSFSSPWIRAGSARFRYRQVGYTFRFAPPAPGRSYVLRARVRYQWRKRRGRRLVVVRRARGVTEAGHRAAAADPPGFSAATCVLA